MKPNDPFEQEQPQSFEPRETFEHPTDIEESITSYLLGDLPPEKAEQTRDLLDTNIEMQDLSHELANTLMLLDKAIAHDEESMSPRLRLSERSIRAETPQTSHTAQAGVAAQTPQRAPRPLKLRDRHGRNTAARRRRGKNYNALPLHILAHVAGLAFFFGFVYLLVNNLNTPPNTVHETGPTDFSFTYMGEHPSPEGLTNPQQPKSGPTTASANPKQNHQQTAGQTLGQSAASLIQRPVYEEAVDPVITLLDDYALAQAKAEWSPYTTAEWVEQLDMSEVQTRFHLEGVNRRDHYTFPTSRHAFQIAHRTAVNLRSVLDDSQCDELKQIARCNSDLPQLLIRPSIQEELGFSAEQREDAHSLHEANAPTPVWENLLNESQHGVLATWR